MLMLSTNRLLGRFEDNPNSKQDRLIELTVLGINDYISKDNIIIFKPKNQSIIYMVGDTREVLLELTKDGDMYIKGNFVKRDKEIYDKVYYYTYEYYPIELPKGLKGEED